MKQCIKSHMQKSNYHQNLRSQGVYAGLNLAPLSAVMAEKAQS